MDDKLVQFKFKMPLEIREWLSSCTRRSMRSTSAEINFILREKMERQGLEKARTDDGNGIGV